MTEAQTEYSHDIVTELIVPDGMTLIMSKNITLPEAGAILDKLGKNK